MRISSCFPSKYLKAADLHGQPVNVIMDYVEMEDIGDTDPKPVLYLENVPKGIILNKTNSRVISNVYGDETTNWKGNTITIFPAMVDYRGETVPAIRVRVVMTARSAERPPTIVPAPKNRLKQPGEGVIYPRGVPKHTVRNRSEVVWDDDGERAPSLDDIDREESEARAALYGEEQGNRLHNAVRSRLDRTEHNGVPAFLNRTNAPAPIAAE